MVQILRFFGFVILLITGLSAKAQDAAAETAINQIMKEHPVAGLSVAVVKKGKLIYTHSFGYKDLENQLPLTDNALFRIASISKSFTVTSLMQLVEKKVLRLKDDVGELAGFKVRNPNYPDKVITLEMLLSHTSGINDSQGYFTLDVIDPAKNVNWQKCYNDYAPGKGYQYCNLNFNIAGTILEKYSGERFDQYVVNHLLKPLQLYGGYNINNLDSSLFAKIYEYNTDSAKFIHSPAAYAPRTKEIAEYVMGYTTPVFSPTGGLKISAPDLARYMMMHMNNGTLDGARIISRKSENTMRKPRSDDDYYGLALSTTKKLIPGETMIGHTGSAYGLFSSMHFEPKKKFGIVVITNGADPANQDGFNIVIRKVVNALYATIVQQ